MLPHWSEIEIAENDAKVILCCRAWNHRRRGTDQLPFRHREFPTAEERLVVALPGSGPAKKHLVVFCAHLDGVQPWTVATLTSRPEIFFDLKTGFDEVFQHLAIAACVRTAAEWGWIRVREDAKEGQAL